MPSANEMVVAVGQPVGHGQGQARLAHAARPQDADESAWSGS